MAGEIAREIVNDPVPARELAGEQGRPVGRAQGYCVERIDEQGAFRGKAVDVGGFEIRMAACMEFVEAQIVDQHHDDVRTLDARSTLPVNRGSAKERVEHECEDPHGGQIVAQATAGDVECIAGC